MVMNKHLFKSHCWRDSPGGPVVKTLHLHCLGVWVQFLIRDLRSHMPHSVAKKI